MRDDAGSDHEREEPTAGNTIIEDGEHQDDESASQKHPDKVFTMLHIVW